MRGRIDRRGFSSLPFPRLDSSASCIAALKICRDSRSIARGRELHAIIRDNGLDRDAIVGNFLIQMYGKCMSPQDAKSAFDRIAHPTSYSWNLLLSAFASSGHLLKAESLYRTIPHPDTVTVNIMIKMYGQTGSADSAQNVFHRLQDKDLVSWNSMLAALAKNELGEQAFHLFRTMDLEGFVPNKVSFVSLLNSCSSIRSLSLATIRMIESLMASYGYETDVIAGTALLGVLGRSGVDTSEAKKVFDRIQSPNPVSWTTMLMLYLKASDLSSAMELFHRMPGRGIVAWNGMIASLAKNDLDQSKSFFDSMPAHDVVSMNSMLAAFSNNPGLIGPMRELFDRLEGDRNLITWNTMIAGYAQAEQLDESLLLFKTMLLHGEAINQVTLVTVIDACAVAGNFREGRTLHFLVQKEIGFFTNAIANVLIKLYTICEKLEYAKDIFESMARPDVVSATAMMTAYGRIGCVHEAKRIFDATLEHDVITWTAVIGTFAQIDYLEQAKIIFSKMPLHDIMSTNTMMVAYGQAGQCDQAKSTFTAMPRRNKVSWNAMIAAYTLSGHLEEALKLPFVMDLEGEQPNKVTFLAAIDAAAVNGAVVDAKLIHSTVKESGLLDEHTELGTSLVNMYGRCGSVFLAHETFNAMRIKSYIAWNALVTAYAQTGHCNLAAELTRYMELYGFVSNEVTFLSNLFAFSHAGKLQEAWKIFLLMQSDYWIDPQMLHYLCVIDLLGRSGTMDDASDLIESMPMEPSIVGWKTLLGASRVHNDIEQGLAASWNCVESSDSSVFALLSSVYTN